jgi:hypothetical protein
MAALALSALLAVAPAASFADTGSTGQPTFSDVRPGYWAYDDIQSLVSKGVVSGYGGYFWPENEVSRAEFAKMAVNAENLRYIVYQYSTGLRVFASRDAAVQYAALWDHSAVVDVPSGQIVWNNFDPATQGELQTDAHPMTFSDVPPSYWGYEYIEAARIAKIIVGNPDGTFAPATPVTREDIATMAMRSLGIASLSHYNGTPVSFADKAQIHAYAWTAVTIAFNLGVVKGEPGNVFAPLATAKRSEAAAIVSRLMNLTPSQVVPLQQQAVVKGSMYPSSVTIPEGNSLSLLASFYNADGAVLPVPATWSTAGGVGTVDSSGTFSAQMAGTGTVTATAQGSGVQTTAAVQVTPVDHIEFRQSAYSVTAGQTAVVEVAVEDLNHIVQTQDSGRNVTLTVIDPENRIQTFTAADQNGVATFTLNETLAGSYDLSAQADGGMRTVRDASLQVNPAAASGIALDIAPSPFLVAGQTANVRVYLTDPYGNQTTGSGVDVALSLSTDSYGTLTPTSQTRVSGSAVLATYRAGNTPGDAVISATASDPSWQPVSIKVTTMQSPAQVVSGKGMWLMHGYDWKAHPDSYFIQQAQQKGITHLYIELGASSEGFWGQDVINGFITKAHQAHIAVIDWIYVDFSHPAADAQMTVQSATYAAPGGDTADGIAADIEENVTADTVTQYATQVRAGLGTSYVYPLIAVTYPPQWRPSYPWTIFGKYFDVLEPMDYWHNYDRNYSPGEAYTLVQQSIQQLRQLTGNPTMPVTIAGQAYDMFGDGQYPTGQEEQAAMQAAKDYGALGYSMYRWGTATNDEWQAFTQFPW